MGEFNELEGSGNFTNTINPKKLTEFPIGLKENISNVEYGIVQKVSTIMAMETYTNLAGGDTEAKSRFSIFMNFWSFQIRKKYK